MKNYDLHVHSLFSDGADSIETLIKKALEANLAYMALTDHDSIDGLSLAQETAKGTPLKVINGIELSVRFQDTRQLHILGLDLDITQSAFASRYKAYRKRRENGLINAISVLNQKDIPITLDSLAPFQYGDTLDRQAAAKWLVHQGYAKDVSRAWIEYLDFIPHLRDEILDLQEALDLIHAAKGKAFLAHIHKTIGFFGFTRAEKDAIMTDLVSRGLDGIEAGYPTFDEVDLALIDTYVTRFDLLTCAGSDYHGANRPEVTLGVKDFVDKYHFVMVE